MKTTKLHIVDYQQFQDLELDFIYSADHPTKAGQPLDKVCFIGPNGCGKTTLMRILISVLSKNKQISNFGTESIIKKTEELKPVKIIEIPLSTNFGNVEMVLGEREDWGYGSKVAYTCLNQSSSRELLTHLSFVESLDSNNFKLRTKKGENPNIKEFQKVDDLFNSIEKIMIDSKLKYEGYDENLKNIAFSNSDSGDRFDINKLSSGIQQLIYRKLPLDEINPQDTIILIDEPETSLFPDIQKQIVKIYSDIGDNNQLFFATHSPIIAGQFEKDEIFALDFDNMGKVILKQKPNGSLNWGVDKLLYHWFGVDSSSNEYIATKERFYELLDKPSKTGSEEQEFQDLQNNPILEELFN
jgi:predicted ATP-dependent endonuclease of OLD family